jgi:HEAT repeat protein
MTLVRIAVLALPVLLLLAAAVRDQFSGDQRHILWLGTAFQILLSSLVLRTARRWRNTLGTPILILYVIAMIWLFLGLGNVADWYMQFAQALMLVAMMVIFAFQVLNDSGAREVHHACMLADRIAARKNWPADLAACRNLPDVKALRESLHVDASPAFALLRNQRPQVRIAALAALEFRRDWRPGQAEMVLEVAQRSEEPAVRASAVTALANVDDRRVIEGLAEFLRDPSWDVRKAAAEALLWDTEHRWAWIRSAVRRTLADAAHQDDGPLLQAGQMLAPEAVKDVNGWVAEKGVLSVRSALTLSVHYERALNENPEEILVQELRNLVVDPHAPVVLRLELAQLLNNNHMFNKEMQEKLLDPMNPAPLRLIAAEALLTGGNHGGAVVALRDVARMPNREIALATADVVQRRLGVDLGLAIGQPLPQVNSRQAAEVTRRVMKWAMQGDVDGASPEMMHR